MSLWKFDAKVSKPGVHHRNLEATVNDFRAGFMYLRNPRWTHSKGTRYGYVHLSGCEEEDASVSDHLHIKLRNMHATVENLAVKDYNVEYVDPSKLRRHRANNTFPVFNHYSKLKANYGELMLVRSIMLRQPDLSDVIICFLFPLTDRYHTDDTLDFFLALYEIFTGFDPLTSYLHDSSGPITAGGSFRTVRGGDVLEFTMSPELGFQYSITKWSALQENHVCRSLIAEDRYFLSDNVQSSRASDLGQFMMRINVTVHDRASGFSVKRPLADVLIVDVLLLIQSFIFGDKYDDTCFDEEHCHPRHTTIVPVPRSDWIKSSAMSRHYKIAERKVLIKFAQMMHFTDFDFHGRLMYAGNTWDYCYIFISGNMFTPKHRCNVVLIRSDSFIAEFFPLHRILDYDQSKLTCSEDILMKKPSHTFNNIDNVNRIAVVLLKSLRFTDLGIFRLNGTRFSGHVNNQVLTVDPVSDHLRVTSRYDLHRWNKPIRSSIDADTLVSAFISEFRSMRNDTFYTPFLKISMTDHSMIGQMRPVIEGTNLTDRVDIPIPPDTVVGIIIPRTPSDIEFPRVAPYARGGAGALTDDSYTFLADETDTYIQESIMASFVESYVPDQSRFD